MKERPIIFNANEVRATLDGHKTQFRRVLTVPWKGSVRTTPYEPYWVDSDGRLLFCDEWGDYHDVEKTLLSPFGKPGDHLWVRETWHEVKTLARHLGDECESVVWYRATEPVDAINEGWRSPVTMPRRASRITLEVMSVRVERLQNISEADARAEGVSPLTFINGEPADERAYRGMFAILWAAINDADAWGDNPWVWVIEFKRVMP
jgi:hypothetical protein